MSNLTIPRTTPADAHREYAESRASFAQRAFAQRAFAERASDRLAGWLTRYSIPLLRISLGLVFLVFGALKLVPGASPAEALAVRTIETLSLGILSGNTALYLIAITELFIGTTLITGKLLRAGLLVLGAAMVGIMSPLVLFFDDLVAGGVTLEAQYVLKDLVLIAAGLVIAARTLGARFTVDDAPQHTR
jgi:uncharacterized membrane protein YphA (DoxX/SURF4 family)